MALVGIELETLVSEPDALTTRPPPRFLISLIVFVDCLCGFNQKNNEFRNTLIFGFSGKLLANHRNCIFLQIHFQVNSVAQSRWCRSRTLQNRSERRELESSLSQSRL